MNNRLIRIYPADTVAAGCHMTLFTTGRGTPFGCPVSTMKISSNSALGAGSISTRARLLDAVLATASGRRVKAEENGFREISIFKDGVAL